MYLQKFYFQMCPLTMQLTTIFHRNCSDSALICQMPQSPWRSMILCTFLNIPSRGILALTILVRILNCFLFLFLSTLQGDQDMSGNFPLSHADNANFNQLDWFNFCPWRPQYTQQNSFVNYSPPGHCVKVDNEGQRYSSIFNHTTRTSANHYFSWCWEITD